MVVAAVDGDALRIGGRHRPSDVVRSPVGLEIVRLDGEARREDRHVTTGGLRADRDVIQRGARGAGNDVEKDSAGQEVGASSEKDDGVELNQPVDQE